jgi:phosphopantothenoylcysteine synthetase/decarboxylase
MESNRLHFLITAGGTREYIDPVRFITNASSGKMGFALADAAVKSGHKVTLITTLPGHFERSPDLSGRSREISSRGTGFSLSGKLKTIYVESAEQMFKAVKKYFPKCDCLIMAAAVADYTPIGKSKTKIKKSDKNLTIRLKPTADILKWAGENKKKNQIVAGFALEDKNLRKNAERKLKDKNLDMIIANTPSAIGAENAAVQIKQKNKNWRNVRIASKALIAKKIISLLSRGLL